MAKEPHVRSFGPLLLQPLRRDGDRGAELLGEQRDAVFLEHPPQVHQLRRRRCPATDDAALAPGKAASAAGTPGTSASRAARRPAGSPGGSGWRGNTAGIAAASPRAFWRTTAAPSSARSAGGCRRRRIASAGMPAGSACRAIGLPALSALRTRRGAGSSRDRPQPAGGALQNSSTARHA